jgi:hypothetical protein
MSAGAELHTNFSLSASGEFLGLFGPNNVVQNELNPYTAGSTITVSATTMVRARAYETGYTASVVDSQTFIDFDTTVSGANGSAAAFSNNLGIVVIDTFGQALNDSTDILAAAAFIPATGGTSPVPASTPRSAAARPRRRPTRRCETSRSGTCWASTNGPTATTIFPATG